MTVQLGPYAALNHRFAITVDDPALGEHLRWMFTTLKASSPVEPVGWYHVSRDERERPSISVSWNDELLVTATKPSRAVTRLIGHLNQQTIRISAENCVLLHAAAVARDGFALVLPAAMESGKTTLAAGLIDRGWDYLTDEAAAIRLDGRCVRGYAKPLSIDLGSQRVLADWEPAIADETLETLRRGQWHVPATARPGGEVVSGAELAALVLPRYREGAATTLRRLSRAEALARAVECTFLWQGDAMVARFSALAEAVRRSRCAELVVSDLDDGCRALDQLWRTTR